MLSKKILRMNKVTISIIIFLVLIAIVHSVKPAFAYKEDGTFRTFGLGYRNKTVVPIWIVSIALAIFSYLFVLYFTTL